MHIDYRLGSRSYYYFDPTEGHAQQGTDSENGIYNIATLSKCVILLFSAVFISIAVRNVSVTLHTYHTAKIYQKRFPAI